MDTRKFGAITSSTDSEKISTTVLGLARTVSGALVFFGLLSAADSVQFIAQISAATNGIIVILPLAYSVWNSSEIVFGLIKKVLAKIFKKY